MRASIRVFGEFTETVAAVSRLRRRIAAALFLTAAVLPPPCSGQGPTEDDLDRLIRRRMKVRHVPGLSLAIVDSGRIVDVRAYGTTTRGGTTPVTPLTLFQAASISKPVTALGALHLVGRDLVTLDENVNRWLRSWKVPENEFTAREPVTLRRLLSHTAGINISGIPGYPASQRAPTLLEALRGAGNTPAVGVTLLPGSQFRYAGGGYAVTQQLIEDVTGQSFADYMRKTVLWPLGMTSSTYEVPLPVGYDRYVAIGHVADRSEVPGGWHNFVESAAAGMWTTPSDLARYVIGVSAAVAGESPIISADLARRMLTLERGNYGLGPAVENSGPGLRFYHGGRNRGFDAYITGSPALGQGAVVMINVNDYGNLMWSIMSLIARKYRWTNYPTWTPEVVERVDVSGSVLAAMSGHYEFQSNRIMTLDTVGGALYSVVDNLPDEEFVPAAGERFVSVDRQLAFRPVRNAAGQVTALEVTDFAGTRRIPRLALLFGRVLARDPDPGTTARAKEALGQLARGASATATSRILTSGARAAFTAPISSLQGIETLSFVRSQDLRGSGVQRHGSTVAHVNQYRAERGQRPLLILVYFDADGLVADFDIVAR